MNDNYQKKVIGDEYIADSDNDCYELMLELMEEKKKRKKHKKKHKNVSEEKKPKKKHKKKKKQLKYENEAPKSAVSHSESYVWQETIAKCLPDALKTVESLLLIRAAKKYDGSFVPSSRFEYNTASKMIKPYTALIETNERTNND